MLVWFTSVDASSSWQTRGGKASGRKAAKWICKLRSVQPENYTGTFYKDFGSNLPRAGDRGCRSGDKAAPSIKRRVHSPRKPELTALAFRQLYLAYAFNERGAYCCPRREPKLAPVNQSINANVLPTQPFHTWITLIILLRNNDSRTLYELKLSA